MGIWSCLGTTLDEVRDALYQGKSGVIFSQERKDAGFRSALCTNVKKPDLKPFIKRNQRQFMPEEAQYAYMATRQALENAKMDQDFLDKHTVGIIYGNDSVAQATMEGLDKFREFKDTAACGSGAIFQSMNSTITMNLATIFKLRGINLTASAACASSSQAIGLGALLISQGLQDYVIAGGAEENNMYGIASFDGIQAFSTHESEPTKASRPFDRDRDGLVPGGGAATIILEDYEHAVKNYESAEKDIDAIIAKLQHLKAQLGTAAKHFNTAVNRSERLAIKRLTYGNPTMKAAFAEAHEAAEPDDATDELPADTDEPISPDALE